MLKQKFTFSFMLIAIILFFVGCSKDPVSTPAVKPIANAGLSLTVQLPINTVSVTGSGTTTNGSIVGYLWTLVSGPNVPVITSPGSVTTSFNGLVAGTYVFQFAVTDNVGLTGVDTMSVLVLPPLLKPIANAGNSPTIQLPINTVTVTGSGTTTNGSIVSYAWSVVSGPSVPVITSPTSPTTTINGLIAGTYIFQFAVTDNAGLTGVDTMSVLVNPPVQQTVTIQPTNNPNDTHVDSYNLIGGAGDTEIEIGAWTIGGTPTNWRSFIKFDQSQIPSTATIISATLFLYAMPTPHAGDGVNAQSGTANAFYVERITGNWNPASFTWSSQPATTIVNRLSVPQSASSTENVTLNVTGIVQDMQTSGNYGFAFQLQNETYYNMRQYASSYYSNASLHPKLVIVYQ